VEDAERMTGISQQQVNADRRSPLSLDEAAGATRFGAAGY
jgi:hypothetical protein